MKSPTLLFLLLPIAAVSSSIQVQAQPKATPITIGVVDEQKLAQSRSDFPQLLSKALPQVAAKRHLAFIVTRQGLKWGQSNATRIDVTSDVLTFLKTLPPTPGALTDSQKGAAQRILSALGALKSITELGGFPQSEFRTRLGNTYITYNANLNLIPAGDLKVAIATAMQGFLDVRTTWDACLQDIDTKFKTLDDKYELRRHNAPEQLYPLLDLQEDKERDKAEAEGLRPLSQALAQAIEAVNAAQKLLPNNPTQ